MDDEEKIERLAANCSRGVPDMTPDMASRCARHLFENDFKSPDDLQFVKFEDLREVLSVGHSRRLIAFWERSSAVSSTVVTTSASARNLAGSSQSSVLQDQAKAVNSVKLPTFSEDSPYIPASVREAMIKKKRAPTKGREDMVQRIVDYCRENVTGFRRPMLKTIALNMVMAYPATFKDTLPLSDHGSNGLAKQMVDKLDNDLRVRNLPLARERQAPAVKEAFGCVQWNPPMPEGETVETLEEKRESLINMHKLTKKQWKWNAIKANMEETFYLQRLDINGGEQAATSGRRKRKQREEDDPVPTSTKGKPILELKNRWPFLFTARGINYHFRILTGQDLRNQLERFASEVPIILDFMASKSEELAKLKRKAERAERGGNSFGKFIGMVLMLVQHFKENRELLITIVDPVTTFEEVVASAKLPHGKTPVLAAAGTNIYNAERYYVIVDDNPVASVAGFDDALTILFSSYFAYNIEYPTDLSCTLIFIQRVIANIHAAGSKSPTFKKSSEKVTKLYNRFQEYKQKLKDEENEEN